MNSTSIIPCNYRLPEHRRAIGELINIYIADEMGGGEPLTPEKQTALAEMMDEHPTAIIFFAMVGTTFAGLLTAFINVSTFTAQPMINIHDVFVKPEFRGLGLGRRLMEAIIDDAKAKRCSRISLEVRFDNSPAQKLYRSLDFIPCDPDMHYWRKYI